MTFIFICILYYILWFVLLSCLLGRQLVNYTCFQYFVCSIDDFLMVFTESLVNLLIGASWMHRSSDRKWGFGIFLQNRKQVASSSIKSASYCYPQNCLSSWYSTPRLPWGCKTVIKKVRGLKLGSQINQILETITRSRNLTIKIANKH